MTTCRCENCHNTFEAQPGKIRNCPYCGKGLLVYQCGSCMKTSGLLMQRQSMVCPRCFTMVRPNERLLIARGPLLLAPPSSPTQAPRKRLFDVMMQPPPVLILRRPQPQLQLQLQLPTTVLQQMEQARDRNCIVLYRVCSQTEAENTVKTLLAGGQVRQLVLHRPSEEDAVQQVANNEGIVRSSDLLERQLKVLKEKNSSIISMSLPERKVVEYSPAIAKQFDGTVVKIEVNVAFTVKGSNLSNENGVILQIGTPLKSAVIYKGDVMPFEFLSPTCKPNQNFPSGRWPPGDDPNAGGGPGSMGSSKPVNRRLLALKNKNN